MTVNSLLNSYAGSASSFFYAVIKRAVRALLCFTSLLAAQEVVIELKNPIATKQSIKTLEGGVLETDTLRIQAKEIDYHKNDADEKIITASGDLFIIYRRKYFLADSISFNLRKQEGVLKNAQGFTEGLFFGGSEIRLNSDGTLDAEEAFFTTSDTLKPEWSVKSTKMHMNERYQVRADKVTLNLDKFPVLWLPSYSMGVNNRFKKKESVLKYRVLWEKGQGPMLLMRWRAWDYDGLKIFLRGEYRIVRGGGGAMELDYQPNNNRQKLQMRNFYAYDSFYNDLNPNKLKSRYRLQGIYSGKSTNKMFEMFARWDALSDKNMRADFPTQLFELSTLERTEGYIKAFYDPAYASIYGRPRINSFRGFKQELPTLTVAVKPLSIGNTNIIFENFFRISYLEYSYADNLDHLISNFRSGRLETNQSLYRSFQWGFFHLVPTAGFKGIFYSNNPKHQSIGQAVAEYDLDAFASLEKSYTKLRHTVEPYAKFSGLTKPTAKVGNVYIFSIQDGYNNLSQLKLGMRNSFSSIYDFSPKPKVTADVYAYNFFDTTSFNRAFPKVGFTTVANLPKMSVNTYLGWNIQENDIDFANVKLGCTVNDYFAFTAEVRHRGKYYWRKNDYDSYILDVTRSINSLANSPLSDARTTFRSKWQLQIAPLWTLRVLNHVGWRPRKPFYHETKLEVQTYISNTWRFRLTYMRTVRTNQVTVSFNLV